MAAAVAWLRTNTKYFLLFASLLLLLSGAFYSYANISVPSSGSIDKYTPVQPCTMIFFYDSASATFGAKDCVLGNLVYGGPGNLGGASGSSAFSVISTALANGGTGAYDVDPGLYSIAGTISLANSQSLICAGSPSSCTFQETSSSTVLLQIQSGSFYNQLTGQREKTCLH